MTLQKTRLSRIHPYPAMIADPLAVQICNKYITPRSRVLDPFCGTGRVLLAAAERGAYCVGVDVNPLASLIVNAKASKVNLDTIEFLLEKIDKIKYRYKYTNSLDLEAGRKVRWFSLKSKKELYSIIDWLNKEKLDYPDLLFMAVILSATVRDVSYSRKDQWKLHRMCLQKRKYFFKSAWKVLKQRLQSAYQEVQKSYYLKGNCYSIIGNSKNLSQLLKKEKEYKLFDIVITSPPYGDSKSTVQYGAMSGLSLGVIKHLDTLPISITNSAEIEKNCLGNESINYLKNMHIKDIKKYWHGSTINPAYRRVNSFLIDLELSCNEISKVIKKNGYAIYVISRRSTGGWRLYLDIFLKDIMQKNGFLLEHSIERKIEQKMTPFLINRAGGKKTSLTSRKNYVHTMRSEYILVFRKITLNKREKFFFTPTMGSAPNMGQI